jgi:hypothetical protein
MFNNITETRIPITLDKEYVLYFNANTMCAFEEATGKNFLATVASLYEAYKPILPVKGGTDVTASSLELIRKVPMSELTALIWAGLHTYNDKDEPVWPLTLSQVRRLISVETIPKLFLTFLRGQTVNSPTTAEMGESQALSEPSETKTKTPETAPKQAVNGGERSIELPVDAFI